MKHRDLISGIFWLVSGLIIVVWSTRYRIGNITKPGPGFFPLGLGLLLIFCSLIILLGRGRGPAGLQTEEPPSFSGSGWKRVAYIVSILLLSSFLFESLGSLITFFFLVVSSMLGAGRQSWKRILLTALLSTFGIYLVFIVLLKQQMPRGFLGV